MRGVTGDHRAADRWILRRRASGAGLAAPLTLKGKGPRLVGQGAGTGGRAIAYSDATSVARSRSSWFIEWRAWAMRSIAALASGFAAMKRSKSVFLSTSSRQ